MAGLGRLKRPLRFLRHQLPPLNFITIHYAYFMTTCLISAVILWGSSTPARSITFIDALFLTVSAMTLAGLNPVNLSILNTFQQVLLFLLLIVGSAIFVSAFVVHVRKKSFEKKFKDVLDERRRRERERRGRSRSRGPRRNWSFSRRSAVQDGAEPFEDGAARNGPGVHGLDKTTVAEEGVTPPAQCGAPEVIDMSVMTATESQLDNDITSEKETQSAPSPTTTSGIQFRADTIFAHSRQAHSPISTRRHRAGVLFNAQGVGARRSASLRTTSESRISTDVNLGYPRGRSDIGRYFDTMGGWVSRNSQFHGLTDREREHLGGYEYRAIKVLSWLVPAYFVLWQLLSCLACGAWVANSRSDVTLSNGLDPWWMGAFNAVSAFNNSGLSLLDANMTAFQTGYYLLLTMCLLTLAGNTCYPIFLRLIVWTMHIIVKRFAKHSEHWAERARTLKFLLDHPRRCYTNLFPARHTWWLLLCVFTLTSIDWVAFEILNIGNKHIEALPVGVRVIDGLFQAVVVRSSGFYVVPISSVRIGLQVLYVVMMYISVYPVVITMRNSNVYEERSLGIYAEEQDNKHTSNHDSMIPGVFRRITGRFVAPGANAQDSNSTFVRQQLRAQLAHDAWILVVALLLIMIIESGQFDRDPANFSVFNFLFEIVSAYGCVGLSIGIPWENYSFSGTWHTLSKLILCVVMLRGRHRGLPVAIDRAVLLPGEEIEEAEEEDGRIRLARTISRGRWEETAITAPV